MNEKMTILLSPSQVNTAIDCRRKWGFSYIDGIKEPPTVAQAFGLALHEIAEGWLRDGIAPDLSTPEGMLFAKGLGFLPLPAKHLEVEGAFRFEDGDLAWRGLIDLVTPRGDTVRVTDHKTTSNFRWAKNSTTLRDDTQAIIYGKHIAERNDLDRVEIQWIYYLKGKRPQAREVIATLTREEINDRYVRLQEIGHELLTLKKTKRTGLDIPVETFPHDGCSSYGGCPHFETCKELHTKEEKPMSDLLAKLKGIGSNRTTPPPVVAAPPVEQVHPTPVASINPPNLTSALSTEVAAAVVKGVEPPKRRPGRPKGSKNKSAKAATPVVESAPAPVVEDHSQMQAIMAPVNVEVEKIAAAQGVGDAKGYTLYIDCFPAGGAGNLDEVLRVGANRAAEKAGMSHYRLIEYGQAPAQLCVEVRGILTDMVDNEILPDRVMVHSSNQCVQDALPELEAFATEIVRAFR